MDDEGKIVGAKNGVQTMLYYYLSSLIGQVEDPKQVIASEIGAMIDFSEAQAQYIAMDVKSNNKMLDNLTCSIDLLKSMEQAKEFDLDSIKIITGILEIMKKQCEETLEKFVEFVDITEEDIENIGK